MGDEGGEHRPVPEAEVKKPTKMTVDNFFAEGGLKHLADMLGNDARNTDKKVFYKDNFIDAHETDDVYWSAHLGRTKLALGRPTLSLGSRMMLVEEDNVAFVDPPPKVYDNKGFLLTYLEVTPEGIIQKSILTGPLNDTQTKTQRERELIEAALETEKLRAERAKEFVNR